VEVRDAIKLAVDHLADAGAPEEVASRLVEGGYSSAKAEGLSAACVLACETARGATDLDLGQLQETLTSAGTRADLAALIAVEVFSDQSPALRLGEVSGVPVLQLLGDLCQLSDEERLAIREELLEPLFARDCRLVVDLGGLSDAPLEVFGILCSDIATLRAAGGDLVLTGLDPETRELATAYRLAEVFPIASDPQAALERLGKLPATPAAGKRFVVLRGEAEGAGVLAIRGAIDARSVERAERKVRKVLAKHPRLVLDLREAPWISGEGFAFLRAISAELGERIKVARILGPAGAAAQAESLSEAITIYADRRAALDAFGPTTGGGVSRGETSSEDLASDEVVEADDPAAEKAATQAAPAAEAPEGQEEPPRKPEAEPAPAPEPEAPQRAGLTEGAAEQPKPKRKRSLTKRQASEQRRRDLEAARLKAAQAAKRTDPAPAAKKRKEVGASGPPESQPDSAGSEQVADRGGADETASGPEPKEGEADQALGASPEDRAAEGGQPDPPSGLEEKSTEDEARQDLESESPAPEPDVELA